MAAERYAWISVPLEIAEQCRTVSDQIDQLKQQWDSSRYWSKDSHYLGLLGEYIFCETFDLAMNWKVHLLGDGGTDFLDVDVKTCTYWRRPFLKGDVKGRTETSRLVSLVILDLPTMRGKVVGVVHRTVLNAAPLVDWGYGPKPSLNARGVIENDVGYSCTARDEFMKTKTECSSRSFNE